MPAAKAPPCIALFPRILRRQRQEHAATWAVLVLRAHVQAVYFGEIKGRANWRAMFASLTCMLLGIALLAVSG